MAPKTLFAVLFFGSCCGFLLPSVTVEVCENLSECTPKLLVQATIEQEGSNWALQVAFDEEIEDEYGRRFAPEEPILLSFIKRNARIEYRQTVTDTFFTAYERVHEGQPPGGCPEDALCCSDTWRTLEHNSTSYTASSFSPPRLLYDIEIEARQGSTVELASLSQDRSSAQLPGITAQLLLSFSTGLVPDLGQRRAVAGAGRLALLVPSAALGTQARQLGLSQAAWLASVSCGDAVGEQIRVAGGDPYDQLSRFRAATLDVAVPGCTWLEERSSLSVQSFDCDIAEIALVLLELSTSEFRLVKLFGEPIVLDSGVLPLHEDDVHAYLFVDIMNGGGYGGSFEVVVDRCCSSPSHCGIFDLFPTAQTQFVDPQDTLRFAFSIVADEAIGVSGACSVRILQHGLTSANITVAFDASAFQRIVNGEVEEGEDHCRDPNVLVDVNGVLFCRSPCTDDEVENDNRICEPVDCVGKYGGDRSVWDPSSRKCVAESACATGTDECVSPSPPSISPSPPEFAPAPLPGSGVGAVVGCGTHGSASADGLSCVCNEGWATRPSQDIFNFVWCDEPLLAPNLPTGEGGVGPTAPAGVLGNPGVLLVPICIVVTLLCCCVAGILYFCRQPISNAVKKRLTKKRSRRGPQA